MSTKIQFKNNDQYDEFKNDHEFFRMIYETWDGVRVEFDDDNRIVEFDGMSEHEVMYGNICLATCFAPEEIQVVK